MVNDTTRFRAWPRLFVSLSARVQGTPAAADYRRRQRPPAFAHTDPISDPTAPGPQRVPRDMAKSGEASTLTVVLAMAANVAVGIAKLIAGLLTGSAAMLSEAAHSLGDTVNEVLLLTALRRSSRPADREHPFGYGKERYFWSLLAAVSIFTAGAMFSIYQGFATLLRPPENQRDVTIGFVVLAAAFVLEGISLAQAIRQVRHEKHKDHLGLLAYLRRTDDPTVTTVLFEDSAALVGLLLAFAGLGLTHLTAHRSGTESRHSPSAGCSSALPTDSDAPTSGCWSDARPIPVSSTRSPTTSTHNRRWTSSSIY